MLMGLNLPHSPASANGSGPMSLGTSVSDESEESSSTFKPAMMRDFCGVVGGVAILDSSRKCFETYLRWTSLICFFGRLRFTSALVDVDEPFSRSSSSSAIMPRSSVCIIGSDAWSSSTGEIGGLEIQGSEGWNSSEAAILAPRSP